MQRNFSVISRTGGLWWRNAKVNYQRSRVSIQSWRFVPHKFFSDIKTEIQNARRPSDAARTKVDFVVDNSDSSGLLPKSTDENIESAASSRLIPADADKPAEKGEAAVVTRHRGPRQKARGAAAEAAERAAKQTGEVSRSVVSVRSQKCVAYCTAESYDFEGLLQSLQKNRIPSLFFSEVIHVSLSGNVCSLDEELDGDVFYFKDGCVVFWDVPEVQAQKLQAELTTFEVGAYDKKLVVDSYSEEIGFHYGKQAGLLPTGELVLSVGQANWAKSQVLEKIAFSYGLQRSVKMSVIESIADDLILSLKHIPDILMDKKALKMDQKGVMKKMGQLLAVRSLINLQLPLSETPEAYWEEPWLEDLYSKISRDLDLVNRVRTLNRKLDYAHQVVEVLRTDLSEKHSTRLEQIIIGLISLEVLFEVVHFFL